MPLNIYFELQQQQQKGTSNERTTISIVNIDGTTTSASEKKSILGFIIVNHIHMHYMCYIVHKLVKY